MNEKAILISFVEDWLKSLYVPVHHITLPCEDYSWFDFGLRSELMDHRCYEFIQHYLESVQQNTIYNLLDSFGGFYIVFRLPGSEELMIYGPVIIGNIDSSNSKQTAERLHLPPQSIPTLKNFYLRAVYFQNPTAYSNIFQTLGRHIFGGDSYRSVGDNLNDLDRWYEIYQHQLRLIESPSLKLQTIEEWYTTETELILALFNSDKSNILDIVSKLQTFVFPQILPDKLREQKNRILMLDTLLRKSVEASCVPPILLESLSNQHMRLVEQVAEQTEGLFLLIQLILDYYELVQQNSLREYSLLTQKIITIINMDLTADLSMSAMSERLNANANYLSTLFKREVGVSLTDYVSEKRIDTAKRLLLITNLPIKTISQKCGIPDIHYFSRQFKKRVGCTPKSFREKHLNNY